MTLCPVSLAVGCQKCMLFKLCPLKSILGNYKERGSDRRSAENNGHTGPNKRAISRRINDKS